RALRQDDHRGLYRPAVACPGARGGLEEGRAWQAAAVDSEYRRSVAVHVSLCKVASKSDALPDGGRVRAVLRRLVSACRGAAFLAIRQSAGTAGDPCRMVQSRSDLRFVDLYAGVLHAHLDEYSPRAHRLRDRDDSRRT